MKLTTLWGLVGLNALLLFGLIFQIGKPNQAVAQQRRSPNYVMIPMAINGAPTEPIIVLDTTNGILGGVGYDEGSRSLRSMPSIDLPALFSGPARR